MARRSPLPPTSSVCNGIGAPCILQCNMDLSLGAANCATGIITNCTCHAPTQSMAGMLKQLSIQLDTGDTMPLLVFTLRLDTRSKARPFPDQSPFMCVKASYQGLCTSVYALKSFQRNNICRA
eukprot:366512-Chlamydomonas_euryale.AAC.5